MMQDLVQEIERFFNDKMNEVHTALPGKILKFDTSTGLAKIKPTANYVTDDGRTFEYPIITDVPVVTLNCGADICVVVPIKENMNCLIIVSEHCLDMWLNGSDENEELRFDLTNAIAIPGLSSVFIAAQKEANEKGTIVIANNKTKICVSKSDIAICGDLKAEGDIKVKGNVKVDGSIFYTGVIQKVDSV